MEGFNRGATNKKQPSFSLRTLVNTELSQITWGELQRKKGIRKDCKRRAKVQEKLIQKTKITNWQAMLMAIHKQQTLVGGVPPNPPRTHDMIIRLRT